MRRRVLVLAAVAASVAACGGGTSETPPAETPDATDGGSDSATEDVVIDAGDSDAGGIPDGGVCVPGAKDCAGSIPRSCDGTGQWSFMGPCPSATSACVDGACLECVPTDRRCVGTSSETCDGTGKWSVPSPCQYLCTGSGTCTGSCAPGSTQCSGLVSQSCDSTGTWKDATTCPFVCSGAGTCSGTCAPGSKTCVGTSSQTCDATGAWKTTATCPFVCSGAGVCSGTCTSGSAKCAGNQPQACDSTGTWGNLGSVCNYACTGAGVCACSRGGFTVSDPGIGCVITIADTVSGLTWDLIRNPSSSCSLNIALTQANAVTICSGNLPGIPFGSSGLSSRLPTQAELTALLAMEAPSTCYSGFDGDSALQAVMRADYFWTSTPAGSGFVAVNTADGTASTTQTKAYVICVK